MPTMAVEFEVFCAKCGAPLCDKTETKLTRYGPRIDVGPCEKCISEAHDKGYSEGQDEYEEA